LKKYIPISMQLTPIPTNQPLCLSSLGSSLVGVDLLSILVVSDSWWWGTVAATLTGTDTNNLAVNGARDTVLQLEVHLGNGVFREYRCIRDISNRCTLYHIPDCEALDCFVFGSASRAVGASDRLYVTTSLLVTSIGRALLNHDCGFELVCRSNLLC